MSEYRIAIAGCGKMSSAWIEYALTRGDSIISAFIDIRPEAAEAMNVKYGLIVGSVGTVIWDGAAAPYMEKAIGQYEPTDALYRHERTTADLNWNGKEWHAGCLEDMFAALSEGRMPPTVCTDSIKSVGMAYGSVQSAKEGRKVMLEHS